MTSYVRSSLYIHIQIILMYHHFTFKSFIFEYDFFTDQVHTLLAGALKLSLTIDETAIQYVISLNVSMCEFDTDHDGCEDVQVFSELLIRKYTSIDSQKRRKRETSKM